MFAKIKAISQSVLTLGYMEATERNVCLLCSNFQLGKKNHPKPFIFAPEANV